MASILEDRLYSYINEKATSGRLISKVEDIADALSESRNPIYKALSNLEKRKKIKTGNRGRNGLEIIIPEQYDSTAFQKNENETENIEEASTAKINENSINIEDILGSIRLLSLEQLRIVKDYVDFHISKKTKGDI